MLRSNAAELRLIARLPRRQDCINGRNDGKRKFTVQSHIVAFHFPDTEKRPIRKADHVKTWANRQVKAPIGFGIIFSLCALNFIASAANNTADSSRRSEKDADLLLLNGNIYTVNGKQPRAQAVAVEAGRIVFVGSNDDARKFHPSHLIDLHGRTVVPGLTDSHCHIFGIGERELTLNLEGANTFEDFLARVKERVTKTEPGKWITGRGWIETFWKPARFPTRQDLDAVGSENPIFLTRADGHASVANSAALKIAGIDKNTANPFGGEILKDKTTGEPTGMLTDSAQELVRMNIPKPTSEERERALITGINRELKLGWCEIQNAGSHFGNRMAADPQGDIDLIKKVYADGVAKIRFVNCVYGPGADAEKFLKEGATIDAFDHHFTQRTIKVVFDGALGSRGAALLKPYSDAPDTSGYLTEKPEEVGPMLDEALRRGLQVETHAIGDRANRIILDLYEAALKAVPPDQRPIKKPRWRVEHAQNVDPADLPRFAKLGLIPSMQPSHAISDLFFAPKRLGMDRLANAYPWQSFLKSGVIICGGSDAPVERGEPMIEFYAAVARKSIKGESGPGWHPEQAVTREQALKMFTIWPAFASFQEKDKGSIEVGKLGDFTVLSADIMKIPAPDILKTQNEMTIIGGEVVYDRPN